MNNDETRPATMEELNALFNSKEWQETKALFEEADRRMEAMNLVPRNAAAEQYVRDRYPIAALYARAELQEIAMSDFEAMLTETEIQAVCDTFYDEYPHEMHEAISNAIEYVLNQRKNSYEQDKSQGNT